MAEVLVSPGRDASLGDALRGSRFTLGADGMFDKGQPNKQGTMSRQTVFDWLD